MGTDLVLLRQKDLVNNPTPRVPICLCLDVSGSMRDEKIDELNRGVELFYQAIKDDEMAQFSAEICIVTFGESVKCEADFASVLLNGEPPRLYAYGLTPMGSGVNLALDLLEQRKQEYKDKGVDYFQPWLVIMTDGYPEGESYSVTAQAQSRTSELVNKNRLTVFPIGIGEDADLNELSKFSPKRGALRLRELKFKEFFEWLSQSVSRTSQSMPGENIVLDVEAISGWGTL